MRVLCLEERLSQPPLESQMDLISMKLENQCWRSVPAVLKLDAIGVPDADNGEEHLTIRRFAAIQRHIDEIFGDKPEAAEPDLAKQAQLLAGSIQIIVASLPRIFTKYKDFWPTDEFLRNLLHFHSLQTFTENVSVMALVSNSLFAPQY